MSTKAASADFKAQRGTKRTCQNPECGSRFYDLNRAPITCPVCNTVYAIDMRPGLQESARAAPKPVKKPAFVPEEVKPDANPEVEGEEALVAGVSEEEETVTGDDETFLEEVDEDSHDVTGIIDAPIEDKEEKN